MVEHCTTMVELSSLCFLKCSKAWWNYTNLINIFTSQFVSYTEILKIKNISLPIHKDMGAQKHMKSIIFIDLAKLHLDSLVLHLIFYLSCWQIGNRAAAGFANTCSVEHISNELKLQQPYNMTSTILYAKRVVRCGTKHMSLAFVWDVSSMILKVRSLDEAHIGACGFFAFQKWGSVMKTYGWVFIPIIHPLEIPQVWLQNAVNYLKWLEARFYGIGNPWAVICWFALNFRHGFEKNLFLRPSKRRITDVQYLILIISLAFHYLTPQQLQPLGGPLDTQF